MRIPRLKTTITAVVLNALHIPLCLALRDPVRLVVAKYPEAARLMLAAIMATTLAKGRPERAIIGAARGEGTVCPNHRAA